MAVAEVKNTASKFSLAKERVLQKLGAHEKFKDQTYYESKEKISKLEGIGSDVSNVLNLWFKKVCELSSASISLSKVWLRVYEGTNERMESVARAYSKEQENIKNSKLPKLAEKIEEFTKEINIYMAGVDDTKVVMEHRRKLQLSFDHYNAKCLKLKSQQQKNRMGGKLETLKQRERFERNTQKLTSAKTAFLQANTTVIKSMHHHWESRFAFLDNLFKQVILNETMFFQSVARTLCSTKPLLQEALKKPLPKPIPPPSQNEMNELNDKVKYGNQTLFGSAENGPGSIPFNSLDSNEHDNNSAHQPLSSAQKARSSSVGSIIGKARADIKFGAFVGKAKNLFSKKKGEGHSQYLNSANSLPLEKNTLEEKTTQFGEVNEVQQKQTVIDTADPFAMFDSNQKQVNSFPLEESAPANPFKKAEVRSVVQAEPWSTNTSQIQEDPFSVAGHSQDPFSTQEANKTSDPFTQVNATPNPFAGEKSEGDLSRDKSSPDPFASFFN